MGPSLYAATMGGEQDQEGVQGESHGQEEGGGEDEEGGDESAQTVVPKHSLRPRQVARREIHLGEEAEVYDTEMRGLFECLTAAIPIAMHTFTTAHQIVLSMRRQHVRDRVGPRPGSTHHPMLP